MTENNQVSLKIGNLSVFIVIAIIFLLFIFDTVIYIQPGHVGVFINKISGKVDEEAAPSGYKFKLPFFQQIVDYPYYMQTIILTQSPHEGSPSNEEINVNSIEGQPVSCDVSLSFNLNPQKVPFLYTSFRQDIDNISHGYIKQSIRQAMQEVIGKMTITDFLGRGKADTVFKVKDILSQRLKQYGFNIRQFTINEIRPPQLVIDAISQKNVMEQDALKAQNELLKIRYEAQQKIELSKGQSKALLMEAQAQAKANTILTQSINSNLVEYKAIDKWDGNLPIISSKGGNVTPLINMDLPPKAKTPAVTNNSTENTAGN